MSHPKELWEDTYMSQRTYPIQLFPIRPKQVKEGDCVLYLHWHSHLEVIMVHAGHITFYIDSQEVEAQAGDIVIVSGGNLHVGYTKSEDQVSFDCLVFNVALFHEWFEDRTHLQILAPYFDGKIQFPVKISKMDNSLTKLQMEFKSILEEMNSKNIGYQLVVKAKLYAWLVQLARINEDIVSVVTKHEPYFIHRDAFKQLLEWIKHHYYTKPTVAKAAKMVGLDPYYFCKQFKKLTGRTFIDYVNMTRMYEAQRLLLESDAALGDIAAQIGCENAAYFTNLYKRYMGVTPSQARKVMKRT